jgi:hypothetical protein
VELNGMAMNATEVNKEQSFGENYFDSGKPITGAFSSYSLEGNYPRFSMLSKIIDKHFKPKRVLDNRLCQRFSCICF